MKKNKVKTKSAAKKRFKKLGSGKIKMGHAFRRHLLTKKSSKRKRHLRKAGIMTTTNAAIISRLIPYA
jgi:large subunit ribosomal protein L35